MSNTYPLSRILLTDDKALFHRVNIGSLVEFDTKHQRMIFISLNHQSIESFINKNKPTFIFVDAREATTNGSIGRNSNDDTTSNSITCVE
ncbi:unnamed protein product [Rotaria sordida]|uniref:Uncharacterized protein n=1 Tax=Rotaria sordida TaxID=392033 RepID=A0A820DID7_9BILA|nr:unnamed protein product [Rotaria sordida]